MSCESLALWTIKTLEEGQTLVKELCCSKLHAANCTHCSLLEMLQRLLQKWRDVYAETDKGQADQSGYIIVDSKSQMKNGGYEQVLPLGKKERRSNFGRRIKSVHESFESPMYCEVRPYMSMEQNIQSLTTSNILTKENCSDSTNKIDPKSFENFEEQGNYLSQRSKTLENKCKFKIVRINTIENSAEQGNIVRQRSKSCESKYKSSKIQEIINAFQNKITKEEEEDKRNKSVYNKAQNENMMKRSGMNSFDVVVDKTSDVESKFSECQVKNISEVTNVPTKPTKPTIPSPFRPRKLTKQLWPRKSPEPLRPVKHAESIKSTKLPEPPRPLKGNICDTPLPFIPVDGYFDVRRNLIIPAESLKPIKQKIPLRPVKSAEPLRLVTHAEPTNSTKPAEPPRPSRPSRPSKGNICDTPLPFIPVDGYLDVRRNRTMPQATDLTEVTRVSNIVVNKNKLGKRIIGIKQNEIFVFPNFYELYADFVLDLNSTFSCNNTDSYLVLQNSAMQVTITFYDKIAMDKWRRITSKNH